MEGGNVKHLALRLFWGRMADLEMPERIASLLFVMAAIAAMSFCQLGFWSIGVIDGKPVYVMLLLAPLVMGSLIFGPAMSALLGLYAASVVYAHACFFPLDFYEVYFMSPLNTFGLLVLLGLMASVLFGAVLRRVPRGVSRACLVVVVSVVLSLVASGLTMLNTVIVYGGFENAAEVSARLFSSPLGVLIQALFDAVLIALCCCVADVVVRKASERSEDRTLLSVFRNWMILVASIVFMLTSGAVFTVATMQAESSDYELMRGETDYLVKQIGLSSESDFDDLLDGYSVKSDGLVVIVDERGTVLASDDPARTPRGVELFEKLDLASDEEGFAASALQSFSENGELVSIPEVDDNGVTTMDFAYVVSAAFDGGFVVIVRSSDTVFESRLGTMAAITFLAVLLILSTGALATALLRRVVVRGIDETNKSLGRITQGDLSERVGVRGSREFVSLSSGINTTVSALKDTIEEVRQRNAQELMTAKAIQESALPTEFPAFPDIDCFDIYASMKTAREVGGDFYDFFLIEGSSRVGFVIADVAGKGIPAALFMMTAKTQIRNYMEAGLPVGEAVDAANHQLCIGNDAGMFVTMFACLLDYETGRLSYVNAGHNPPLVLHDGSWEWMRSVSGMPLGLFEDFPYEPFERQLSVGDMLYLYTDGVTEAMNAEGELFGEDRLEKTLNNYSDFNPRSTCVGIRRAITDFTLDCDQSDDITMLGLKYGVPPETNAVMILDAKIDQLVHVCNYVHAELHRRHAPKSVYNPIDIAAEELFVNVCRYAYPDATPDDPGEVRISFEYASNPPSLTLQITDDGIPYNPLDKPDAVTPDDIADVPIGGLGILMAKNSVDDMTYERVNGSNVLTIVKQW